MRDTVKMIHGLSPQCQTVLRHLAIKGSLTPVEAAAVYKIRSLPRRVLDLKEAGVGVMSVRKVDLDGQRYVRYQLHAATRQHYRDAIGAALPAKEAA